MRKQIFVLLLLLTCATGFTQTIFPGLSETQKQKLLSTKIPMPLPTWIPEEYSVTNIITKTGKSVKIENKILTITYGKKLPNGRMLEFKIDAGFDGIGDLMYEGGERVKSKVGDIWLFYEPYDEDMDGKKTKVFGLIMTEWIDIKNLAFHVVFSADRENQKLNRTKPKISKADAKKVLQSMEILK